MRPATLGLVALVGCLPTACSSKTGHGRSSDASAVERRGAPADASPAAPSRVDAYLTGIERQIAELDRQSSEARAAKQGKERDALELAHMVEVDQLLRTKLDPPHEFTDGEAMEFTQRLTPRILGLDAEHLRRLKELLAKYGWFKVSEFGKKADVDAWLLVQHADRDVDFQKQVLSLLEGLMKTGETDPQNYAYLYDRVAVAEGRPERYGTQGRCAEGHWEPFTLEEPARVDERRQGVGLPPLREYIASFGNSCR